MGFYQTKVLPTIVDYLSNSFDLDERRQHLLGQAIGHVCEIGSATGGNFLYYLEGVTSLTAVEPNHGMNLRARKRVRYLDFPVDIREQPIETLDLKDASFDVAVSTFTLCRLAQAQQCAAEIFRVLKPGGKLLYLENTQASAESLRRWQDRLSPLQKKLWDGHQLNVSIPAVLASTKFDIGMAESFLIRGVPKAYGFATMGVARKPQ